MERLHCIFSVCVMCGVLASVQRTSAFPTGSPVSACSDLMPVHIDGELQKGASPYMIILNDTVYGSAAIRVSITAVGPATKEFMAFMLQARNEAGSPQGNFGDVPVASKAMTCYKDGDTLTHTAAFIRQSMEVTWFPPANNVGKITITGSIALSKVKYWAVESAPVSGRGAQDASTIVRTSSGSGTVSHLSSACLILLTVFAKLANRF
ncbi:reelin domain-containing protein 1-like [Biomphalaria glabrata]|uniref:Reelin domain-containing protein 1-like n=1 Tax=Biomphalaria glabrata TaxID=6526 RepID=A0A9W2ZIQ0_BIOGL|nr:reelin domain-containing protein 1-like [Biomphalaria glabrata]XP_055874824.1 reelin domain-containing protein 1-like [Biomphalaria glabrata]